MVSPHLLESAAPRRYKTRIMPTSVRPVPQSPWPPTRTKGQAFRRGIKYEAKVHRQLSEVHGLQYIPQQWWQYTLAGDHRDHYCQTDGLLILSARKVIVLCEVKYSHTPEAYWQVENVYVPLLTRYLRNTDYKIAAVEVCKWFDPNTPFPVRPTLCEELTAVHPSRFSVHILNR